jgi:hypothetical protein
LAVRDKMIDGHLVVQDQDTALICRQPAKVSI